jgi:membrane-associated protein
MFDALHFLHSKEFIDTIFRYRGADFALLLLFVIIFAETGLLVGFFLPGDSMLIAVGALVATTQTSTGEPLANIWVVYFVLMAGAIIGDQVGYILGLKSGTAIFKRDDSRFFKKKYVTEAHEFYERHGAKAIILARFVPIFRTFVPFMAGVAKMPYRSFVFFNIAGGIIWVTSLLWAGYGLGKSPWADKLDKIILLVIFVSVLPVIIEVARRFWPGAAKEKSVAEATVEAVTTPGAETSGKALNSAD